MNTTKKFLGNTAALGATFSLAILSVSGMFIFTSSLGWAITTFFLAAAIEGAVYRQNILLAMNTLGNHEKTILRAIAKRELEKLKTDHSENDFIHDYFNQKNYLHELLESKDDYSEKDKKIAEREIQLVEKRLEEMELAFVNTILKRKTKKTASLRALKESGDLIQKYELQNEIDNKKSWMNIGAFFALGSGICAGLVTLAGLDASLVTLKISASLLTVIGVPLVVGCAALGYSFLMYHTMTNMIKNDTLYKWKEQIKDFWHTPSLKRNTNYYLKFVGVILFFGLTAFATVATAGTWWYLAKSGAELVKPLSALTATILSIATWAMTLVPTILFNAVNGLKSVKKIPGVVMGKIGNIVGSINSFTNTISEGTWQISGFIRVFNPFYWLSQIMNAAVFLGHLVSVGIISDRVPWLNPVATTATNTLMEGLNDLHYVVDEHTHHDHTHDHNHNHDHEHDHHHHDHAHDEEEHHHHGDFVTSKINVVLGGLAVAWDWFLSGFHSWKESKEKFFPSKPLPAVPEKLSAEWARLEVSAKCNEYAREYRAKGIIKKADAFAAITQKLKDTKKEPNFYETLEKTLKKETRKKSVLAKHRHPYGQFFSPKIPASKQLIKTMLADRSYSLKP